MSESREVCQAQAQVLSVQNKGADVFVLRLFCPEIARIARPGQFVHVKCGDDRDYILRRPFSIHRVTSDSAFELLIRKVGKGTRFLSGVTPQSQLDMIGPLGNGFEISGETKKAVVVAGGLGVAPIVFLAEELISRHVRLHTILGAQTRDKLYYYMDFKRMGRDVHVATDDSSQGHGGFASELVPRVIEDCSPDVIYACGPEPMLAAVADFAGEYGVPCQVCLEAYMACGVGACLSCVCETVDGPLRVCVDGPVFDATRIVW